jgi:NTE family protein
MDTAGLNERYRPPFREQRLGLALCLSGGGFRATLFHAGALRRLNELGILSTANTISSVSGGSIANGLLASVWSRLTPDAAGVFTNWKSEYEEPLRRLCSEDIRTRPLLWWRLDPRNWPRLASAAFSAADLLAEEYDARLFHGRKLVDLPAPPNNPNFVFCAANLQTGVNFQFSKGRIGDYVLGFSEKPGETLLADAVAASSAFPITFPPLVRDYEPAAFHSRDVQAVPEGWRWRGRVELTDGGVYDNMALEPAWKAHKVILVSDGGTPFQVQPAVGRWAVPRLWRSYSIIANQAEAVRKRWLIASFLRKVYGGAYWGLGTDITEYALPQAGTPLPGYSGRVLDRLRVVRTDLDAFSADEQGVLMNHGWALANGAISRWAGGLAKTKAPGQVPDPGLLDPDNALMALAESDAIRLFGRH